MVHELKQHRVSAAFDDTLIIERRYTPTWAVVLAVAGLFAMFVLSLLFLLISKTELVAVSAATDGGGSVIRVNGTLQSEVLVALHTATEVHAR